MGMGAMLWIKKWRKGQEKGVICGRILDAFGSFLDSLGNLRGLGWGREGKDKKM